MRRSSDYIFFHNFTTSLENVRISRTYLKFAKDVNFANFAIGGALSTAQVKPDMITYSMLIKAQCDAGEMGKALQILEDMLQCQCDIDDVVFT